MTGEHGVGLLKRAGLSRELSPAVLEMHRAVKAASIPTTSSIRARSSDQTVQSFCRHQAIEISA